MTRRLARPIAPMFVLLLALCLLAASCGDKGQVKDDKTPEVANKSGDAMEGGDEEESGSKVGEGALETMRAMRDGVDELSGIVAKGEPNMADWEKERVLELLQALENRVDGLIEAKMSTGHKELDGSLGILKDQIVKAKEEASATPPTYSAATNVAATCLNCHASLGGQ